MRRFRPIPFLLTMILVLSGSLTHIADAGPQNVLLQMLARVPNTGDLRTSIVFADLEAVTRAYPPAQTPTSVSQITNLRGNIDSAAKPFATWWYVVRNMMVPRAEYAMQFAEKGRDVVGFDLFDVDRALSYGLPPGDVLQYDGHFDRDAIRSAFTALGFQRQDRTDAELWCSSNGCEGTTMDVKSRNVANPFGGALGRKQPLLIGDGYVISSARSDVMDQHIKTINSTGQSIADVDKYRAAIETVSADGLLLQATILDSDLLALVGPESTDPLLILLPVKAMKTAADRKAALQQLLENYQTLPSYTMLIVADVVTDTEQSCRIALVFDDATDANIAAKVITDRINQYQMRSQARPMLDMLKSLHVSDVKTQVVKHESTGKAVLMILFSAPRATPDDILSLGDLNKSTGQPAVTAPGMIYRTLVNFSIFQRDAGWLSMVPRERLEELLKAMG